MVALAVPHGLAGPSGFGLSDDDARPLMSRQDVLAGSLKNGLDFVIKRHPVPEGHASIRLVIDAGSVHEDSEHAGAAMLASRLLFSESRSFPDGRAAAMFRASGIPFERAACVRVGYDNTVYSFDLQQNDLGRLDLVLRFLRDVADGLVASDAAVERERRLLLAEERAQRGVGRRINDELIHRLFPDSVLSAHPPMADQEDFAKLSATAIARYHSTNFAPDRMTLVATGDLDPDQIRALIDDAFASMVARSGPNAPAIPAPKSESLSVMVAADDELSLAVAELLLLRETEAVTTERAYRELVTEELANEAVRQRLLRLENSGDGMVIDSLVESTDWFGSVTIDLARVVGPKDKWQTLVHALMTEIARIEQHGFEAGELDRVRDAVVSRARQAARLEEGIPCAELANEFARTLQNRSSLLSAQQRLSLTSQFTSLVADEEIVKTVARRWLAPGAALIIVAPPEDSLSEESALALAQRTRTEPVEALEPLPTFVLAAAPDPPAAPFGELTIHPKSGVVSGWLCNGVRVHHKQLTRAPGLVHVSALLAGGKLNETDRTRGLTQATTSLWEAPAACSLSSGAVMNMLLGRNISFKGRALDDGLLIEFTADIEDLELAMRLFRLFVTEPLIEPVAFERWRSGATLEAERRQRIPALAMNEVLNDFFYGRNDVRFPWLRVEEIRNLCPEQAQRWLDDMVHAAPLEVSIVGDIEREQALQLAANHLSTLPPRDRIGPHTLSAERIIEVPAETVREHSELQTSAEHAIVVVGSRGADVTDRDGVCQLDLAQRVLQSRLNVVLREREPPATRIVAQSWPSESIPNTGVFCAVAMVEPDGADAVSATIESQLLELSRSGPTPEELEVARQAALAHWQKAGEDAQFWSRLLTGSEYRSLTIDDVMNDAQRLKRSSIGDVREAVHQFFSPQRRFTIVVSPSSAAEDDAVR